MISKKNKARTAAVLAAAVSATAVIPAFAPSAAAQSAATDDTYVGRFAALYDDVITNGQENGYLSSNTNGSGSFGIPYHSVETVICEAPDYGHETTSEAMSYIVWVTAMRDALGAQDTNDLSATNDLSKGWKTLEAMIPGWSEAAKGSSTTVNYKSLWSQSRLKADSAPELDTPQEYPTHNQGGDAVNPLFEEFKSSYRNDNGYYLMHWLADVDNWYGFGGSGSSFTFINTFQRGRQESCFETVPHPAIEECIYGAGSNNGIKAIFNGSGNVAPQYAFTNAPDAEDRAIQAVYFANVWGAGDSSVTALAGKMGDQLRNDMFDKYYKAIGCQDIMTGSSDYSSAIKGQHFLRAWYTSWGGALGNYDWAWQIGCSHSHEFYQNPLAAYALLYDSGLKAGMLGNNAVTDYEKSLKTQIELYLWLQSAEGPIGGGCTNSLNGRYEKYPEGMSTFNQMAYVAHPVYADPGSNHWIGNQVWAIQRLAELYYYVKIKGDATNGAKDFGGLSLVEALDTILSRWIDWFIDNIKWDEADEDGNIQPYMIPSTLNWGEIPEGEKDEFGNFGDCSWNRDNQPATWTGKYDAHANDNYHCTIAGYGYSDVGCVSSLCNTLIYYAAANKVSNDAAYKESDKLAENSLYTANKLLSAQWDNARDEIGLSYVEHNGSLSRLFTQDVYIPSYYNAKMPDGSVLANGATFASIRKSYEKEEKFMELKNAYKTTGSTEDVDLTYHRFWHAGDALMSYGSMALLFPEVDPISDEELKVTKWGDADVDDDVDMDDVVATLCAASGMAELSAQGALNADVYQNGDGISVNDAGSIQKYLALQIDELPESYL